MSDSQNTTMFGRVRRLGHDTIGITLWGDTEHVLTDCQASAIAALIRELVEVDDHPAGTPFPPRFSCRARAKIVEVRDYVPTPFED